MLAKRPPLASSSDRLGAPGRGRRDRALPSHFRTRLAELTSAAALRLLPLITLLAVPGAIAAQSATPATAPPQVLAHGTQAGFGEVLVLGPGARLAAAPQVPADATRLLDGAAVATAQWETGWVPGSHEASVQLPGAAAAGPSAPLRFVYDPQAPVLQWQVGEPALLEGHGLDQNVERRRPPRHTLPRGDRRVPLLWSADGRRWLPLLPADAEPNDEGLLADWLVASDRPQVFLWALADGAFSSAAPVAPTRLELVRVWAADELSAVRDLHLRLRPAGDGHSLEMVATDLVGNTTTVTWPLGRR
jgi:hypothetical protein